MTSADRPPSAARRAWGAAGQASALLVLGAFAFVAVYGEAMTRIAPDRPDAPRLLLLFLADIPLGIAVLALFALRRRAPVLFPAIGVALSALSAFGTPAALAFVVSVAARRRPREIALVSILLVCAATVDLLVRPDGGSRSLWEPVIGMVVLATMLVLIGLLIGSRRQLRAARAEQAASAALQHAAELESARAQERTRIAREMHDVLAHRLSLVTIHAGGLEYRDDLTLEQARETAGVIRENSHRAVDELRDVLGVLRDDTDDDGSSPRPQPTLRDIAALVEEGRAVGTPVRLAAPPDAVIASVPEAVGRHIYRIVQEILTNARRHAPGAAVSVQIRVDGGSQSIRLSASNLTTAEVPSGASGFGLAGMAERIRLAGGTFDAGHRDGLFVVDAVLPWTS
ncbi:histidine kinase [Microbacterium betulae]|uniref:histidine kinase n=1 Tax=Microbacterium betulae TaxID=2981139 RepID=A0AA97I5L8_9MICO|nr:histidine kinase [Microbacterium sp. AB]WOF23881.1 histidine kinase [Microbacterium sp. AB]